MSMTPYLTADENAMSQNILALYAVEGCIIHLMEIGNNIKRPFFFPHTFVLNLDW